MQEDRVISELSPQYNQWKLKSEDESGIFDFSRLPWVVFLKILKFFKKSELCRYCLVNKLWHKACLDPTLWRYLDLGEYCSISDENLNQLTSYSNNVVKLRIAHCKVLTDSGLSGALKQCPALVECSIYNCRDLSDDVLTALGEYCHALKKLDITLCLGFSNNGIKKVCEGCPDLEEIVIDQCAKLTNETLVHLGRHSSMLKCISATAITNLTDEGLLALLQGCWQLETLRFPFCGLTNKSIDQIVRYCVKIVYLDVRDVELEDNDVSNMVMSTSLTKLETLNLGLCYNLTDASARKIGLYCKEIKHLFLVQNKVTDEGMLQLSKHCANLLHLDVSWCEAVTEIGARYILKGCPKLKHLGLFRCDKVSESAVNKLIMEFPNVFISTLKTEMNKFLFRNQEDVNVDPSLGSDYK